MRILVLGGDGYLGWPSALHLSARGHDVAVVDNFVRRSYDLELGVGSLVPIESPSERVRVWHELTGRQIPMYHGDLTEAAFVHRVVGEFLPDSIVHFAEQRSAPYSMIDQRHAVYTQFNNVVGTLNVLYAIAEADRDIHLVKLGTMGEYGTPNIDIEEGWLEITHKGRTDTVLYPKRPGSFYHLSKVHDSHNIEFACRVWGLRATDLNQGIVYGQETDETTLDARLCTRLDYDAVFGTVLNRMAIQAVLGHPLTVYGTGGQTRGLINIVDTVECIRLSCENPAERGEFRVFNQFTEQMSVMDIAETVARTYPGICQITTIDNPRIESEEHYYRAAHTRLLDLGLMPHLLSETLLGSLFGIIDRNRDRVNLAALIPEVRWEETAGAAPGPTVTDAGPAGPGGHRRPARILVTGGSGFIGRHLVRALHGAGADVMVADLTRHPDTAVPTIDLDLRLPGSVERALEPGIDAVVHLAAATSVLRSVDQPAETFDTNVSVTAALLERARQCGVGSFVFASTNAVVGGARHFPINEATGLAPLTPYGATKAAAEMLLSAYQAAYGIRATWLRFTNVYGPDMSQKDSIVARLMKATVSGTTFEVYGDGSQIRDYLYVDDAVAAIRLALGSARVHGPVVVGSERSTSVLELVAAVRQTTGVDLTVRHGPAKAGEMAKVVVDASHARSLGWRPAASLEEGLTRAWDRWPAVPEPAGLGAR